METPSLNAPFGAQCFPTLHLGLSRLRSRSVSMHLLVLSAFRPEEAVYARVYAYQSQCTFWCSVLSDWTDDICPEDILESQCTFWCSVLSDYYV